MESAREARRISELDERLAQLCPQLGRNGAERAQVRSMLAAATADGDRMEADLAAVRTALAEADARLDRLSLRLATAEYDQALARIEVEDNARRCEALTRESARLRGAIAAKDVAIEAMQDRLQQGREALEEMKQRLAAMGSRPTNVSGVTEGASPAADGSSGDVHAQVAAFRRQIAAAESQAALEHKVLVLIQEMLAVLAAPGKWWLALVPSFWARRHKYRTLKRKGLFDAAGYLKRYPDIGRSKMDPLHHYIVHGLDEGRSRS